MERLFSLTRALVARKRKIFALFFALAASIGMMNAKVTWNSSNVSDLYLFGTDAYSKEGVTLSGNGDRVEAAWDGYGDESMDGISFRKRNTGGYTFSNTLGKNFTKIEMTLTGSEGWDMVNLGSGWLFGESFGDGPVFFVTWTGNASTVDLLNKASDFHGDRNVKRIVFYFVGDSEEPDPTYTVALEDGTVNADKVTLSKTSAEEGATVTVTPNEEYEITAFSAYYVVVNGQVGSINTIDATLDPATGAYRFTMPAYDVTIDATIALKPVPEGDIFAGFTATAGSGGFTNEGHANLVDGKFTSGNVQTDWTKWCTNNDHRSVPTGESGDACWWIDFEASAALDLTGYILTTGNDTGNEHGRNPRNWVLKAKLNADDAWTTIATVTNDVTMKNQSFKDYKFFVDQSGSYKYFRFEVFANQGANVMQLCELRLIGTEAPAPAPTSTTTVTWDSNTLSRIFLYGGEAFPEGGVTLTLLDGEGEIYGPEGRWMGESPDASFKFSTSLGNFTRIEITATINGLAGSGWMETSPGAVWTGDANETTFGGYFENVSQIVFTIEEPAPTPAEETTTVTWNSTDFTEEGTYTSHKGIEVNPGVDVIDIAMEVPIVTISPYGPGSFSTTNSNLVFTKIEVSGGEYDEPSFEGEGWSDSEGKRVWEGQAATVPFNLGFISTGDEGNIPWTIVFTLAPATPKAYSSGTVALKDLIVGDTLMAGVTLTDDSDSKVKFVPSRLKINGNIYDYEFTLASFVNTMQTPLLGENAAMTLNGGFTITPINEEGNDGNAWVVTENYVEADIPVTLAGIGTQSGSSDPTTTTTVTWNSSTISSINIRNGESFTEGDVTVTVLNGQIDRTSKWKGNSVEASFKFSTSLGNFTRIEITGEIRGLGGSGWTQDSPGAVWTGDANEITFGMYFKNVTQIVFTIEEHAPAPSVTLPQAIDTLVYNGEAQTLIAAGEAAGFTFQYKVGENGEYSTDLPTATNAGSYTVYYKATNGNEEQDITGSVEVSIAKAALTITAENKEVVYGYAAPGFSVSYYGLKGSDLPADVLTGELAYACDYTAGSNAGEYDITPSGQTSANYDITYVNGKLVVYKADPAFTAPTADTLTYNGGAQILIAAGTTEHGTFEYTFTPNDEQSWNTALPQAKNADTYGVYYRIAGDANHNDYESADAVVVTIAQAALTATADDKSVIYGDDAPEYTVTYEGWQGEDNADVLSGTIAYACEYAQTSNVGEYDIVPSGVSNPDYAITFVNGKVTVSKAQLTITADDKSVIYGDEVPEYTAQFEGFKNEDDEIVVSGLTLTSEYVQTSNVGEYAIVPANATAQNYAITFVNGTLTVNKAALTITAENKEVVYGYAAPGFSVSYSGLKGSDLPADVLTGELAYACDYTIGSNAGEYDITPSGQTSANYDITYVKGTLVVYKADPAFTAPTANTLTYNGGAQTLIAAGTTEHGTFEYTFTPNDEESWNTALPQAKNADTYGVYYRIAGDANHNDYESADAVVVTIAQAALTATADDKSVIYGDDAPEYTVTYEGWQGEDNADVLSGTIAYACEYARTSNVGEYTIVPSGVSNPDYVITFVNGKVTVSKAQLTITAEDKSVIYGDEAPAFTASYEGFKNEDDEIVVSGLTLTSEYVLTSNVGEYAIVPADATAQNYAITFVNGTLTVNKAALMITAEDKEVTYGDEAPAFTVTYEGFKNEDDEIVVSGLTLTSEYVQTSNVGEYDIVPADATAQNYAISYTNGTLTVNQAPLTITAEDKSVIYGDEAPAFTAQFEGFKNEDDEIVVSGLTLTSEYVQTSNVGEYDIVPANAEAQNYAISYTNGTLTVNQAALTITAEDKSVIYGDEAPAFTVTYEGFKNEDDEAVVSGLNYTCAYAPGSYIGTYVINPNSATAQNYAITFVDGTLTVNQAAVKVTDADIQEAKFEDGNTAAVVLNAGQLEGIKLNDPIGHVTTATFSDATVGEGKTITMFYELTGDAALLTNYNLTPTSEIFAKEGTIIENFIPNDNPEEKDDDETEVKEGIEVYAYGYCLGDSVGMSYHLNSGNPDQYKIEFEDSLFTDVDWTDLDITGPDGIIYIEVPVDVPTGDYQMTVTFRDSRFTWLPSNPMSVTFHVNLPQTYVMPMFDNTIALVDTCECFTDIQWYHRADASEPWVAIPGATGHYYRPADGSKLTGEFFVQAKMNGVPTYTCGQADMETLYGAEKPKANVKAFPNPVANTTTVTIENSENYEHSLRIVNLTGAEMFRTTFEGNETKVDMDGFVQGNYMIYVDGIVVKVMKK